MANPLFETLSNRNGNDIFQFINKVKEMQNSFKGNPQEEVQKLLDSGRMTQAQFNEFAQIADKIRPLIK